MRILAIDYGTKRLGVAMSDPTKTIAQPVGAIAALPEKAMLNSLLRLLKDNEVELILVGMPRNMNGTYGAAAEGVRKFADTLSREIKVQVKFWDERLTSAQANRVLIGADVSRSNRKGKVDPMAAAILLQSYLDSLPEA
ncbi:MAG: Holliday junction resolvase RuvX [Verrucomicrobia bacterium]|nr:Holliday junction resolvase RuvX [Verrucomicrobiota bacterium]MCF7709329.1 Holliday junction resolvase RuvX [Verrucomicrobiota bacterium]